MRKPVKIHSIKRMSQGEIDLCGIFLYNLIFSTSGQKLVLTSEGDNIKMSYAIIRTGGKQFPVTAGQTLRVPTIDEKTGGKINLEALVSGEGADAKFGGDLTVSATVLSHGRGDKVIVFKKKRRKQYKRKQGHRQGYTEIKIEKF